MPRAHSHRLLACLLLALPVLASAQQVGINAQGSASLTGITFKTYDLDPSDGQAAGYVFNIPATASSPGTSANSYIQYGYVSSLDDSHSVQSTAFAPLQSSLSDQGNGASSATTANSLQSNSNTTIVYTQDTPIDQTNSYSQPQARASGNANVYAFGYETRPDGLIVQAGYLEIAPNTVLEITGIATVAAQTWLDQDCAACTFTGYGRVDSSVILQLRLEDADLDGGDSSSYTSSLNGGSYFSNFDGTVSATGSRTDSSTLRVTFANTTNTTKRLILETSAFVNSETAGYVRGLATPSPEPSTYALVGLGLAAAGWTARRRRAA